MVHTHSIYCTTFAVLGQPVRAVHYVIGDANTDTVLCAPYRTFGTVELAEAAIKVCGDSNAVLLANHGLVVCGGNIQSAYSLACNMEYIAELQYRAMCIGTPNILSKEKMDKVLEKFKTYGQTPGKKTGY
ncbi:L-fuculose phosphate aldolase [bioreactor metagenome]|uniref:L-fuculose phosphate aldolase n=1 Tax=bioreactor metagenome TaxID=1076179 RepID=A0A644XW39_9ZZZZ